MPYGRIISLERISHGLVLEPEFRGARCPIFHRRHGIGISELIMNWMCQPWIHKITLLNRSFTATPLFSVVITAKPMLKHQYSPWIHNGKLAPKALCTQLSPRINLAIAKIISMVKLDTLYFIFENKSLKTKCMYWSRNPYIFLSCGVLLSYGE